MSTFAVFGMTEHFAREEAKKKTPTTVGKTELTPSQWLAAVESRAEKTMASSRIVQLSSMFDAPQFAEHFIELLRKSGKTRDLKIRAKVKIEVQDSPRGKKKAPSTTWRDALV